MPPELLCACSDYESAATPIATTTVTTNGTETYARLQQPTRLGSDVNSPSPATVTAAAANAADNDDGYENEMPIISATAATAGDNSYDGYEIG